MAPPEGFLPTNLTYGLWSIILVPVAATATATATAAAAATATAAFGGGSDSGSGRHWRGGTCSGDKQALQSQDESTCSDRSEVVAKNGSMPPTGLKRNIYSMSEGAPTHKLTSAQSLTRNGSEKTKLFRLCRIANSL